MRRGRWADEQRQLLAAAQDGVITAKALVALGVPESTVYRRCRQGGLWQLLAPGVVLLSSGTPTTVQRERAALLHAGPTAMLTGASAARLHGMRRPDEPTDVHVLVDISCQVRSVKGVLVERTRRLPDAQLRRDMPVAPLVRCVLDLARRMKDRTEIAAILTEPVQRRRLFADELVRELDAGCRKHSAAPREVLRAVEAGVESPAEYDFFVWWGDQPELPPVEGNVEVYDEDGARIGKLDLLSREGRFGVEVNSVEFHFATREQVTATADRIRAYRGAGLYVLSLRPCQRRDDPAGTLRDILDGLAVAALLPPPRVTYGSPPPRPA